MTAVPHSFKAGPNTRGLSLFGTNGSGIPDAANWRMSRDGNLGDEHIGHGGLSILTCTTSASVHLFDLVPWADGFHIAAQALKREPHLL